MFSKNYFLKSRLCLVTDRNLSKYPLINAIEEAVSSGIDMVQLREKDMQTKEYFELARQIKIICKKYSALFIINDRIDIALAVEADGVHLGWKSLPFHIARHLLGKEKIIGLSAHSKDEAVAAQEKGADYITLGPVFPTASKNGLIEPLGCNIFSDIRKSVRLPVFAIGGIKENNIGEIIKAGANGIAVISAILQADNIKETVKRLTPPGGV
ncbi:MAG: thiamine phosphate synthase [bacterium]|nr:thiamine phosphate synthase [bacterium]